MYRHVGSRDELVAVAMDRAVRMGLSAPPGGLTWRQTAEWQSHTFRDFLLAHPGLVSFMRGTERLSPSSLAGLEGAIGLFVAVGLSVGDAYAAASALATFVVGSVQFNLGVESTDPDRRRLFESLGKETHPILTAHAEEISRLGSREEFEFGLAALLDGIEARATKTQIS